MDKNDKKAAIDLMIAYPVVLHPLPKPIREKLEQKRVDLVFDQVFDKNGEDLIWEETKIKLKAFLKEIQLHQLAHIHQRKIHRRQISKMKITDLMVIVDYTKQETKSEGKLNILTFTIILKNPKTMDTEIHYYDYFFDLEMKGDEEETLPADVLACGWRSFFGWRNQQGSFFPKRLFVWSDRGGKDFMNHEVIEMYGRLSKFYNLKILYSTFEAKHGHSICDGHFGTGKKKLRREINFQSSSRVLTKEFVQYTFSTLHNTQVFNLTPSKGALPALEINKQLPIKRSRCFLFQNESQSAYHFTPVTD